MKINWGLISEITGDMTPDIARMRDQYVIIKLYK